MDSSTSEANFAAMKIAELKNELRKRGLKVSGKKRELFERLQQATKASNVPNGDARATPNLGKFTFLFQLWNWSLSRRSIYLVLIFLFEYLIFKSRFRTKVLNIEESNVELSFAVSGLILHRRWSQSNFLICWSKVKLNKR